MMQTEHGTRGIPDLYDTPCPTHLLFRTIPGSVFLSKDSRAYKIRPPPHFLTQTNPNLFSVSCPLSSSLMEEVSNNSSSSKRPRSEPEESPEAKRIRADVLDILAYDEDQTDSVEDLACVMQSLQEEISTPSDGLMLSNLDYLLEASDDELGLPPTVPSPAWDVGSETESVGETEVAECGQIWGFGDDFHLGFSDDLDSQIQPEADGVVMFDDGLFDDFSGAADVFETWRSASLLAM